MTKVTSVLTVKNVQSNQDIREPLAMKHIISYSCSNGPIWEPFQKHPVVFSLHIMW